MSARNVCLLISALAAGALGGPGAASAGLVASTAADPPVPDHVVLSQTLSGGAVQWKNATSGTTLRRDVGQTFKPAADFTLDRITLLVSGVGSAPGEPFALTIYRFPPGTGLEPAATVTMQTGTFPSSTPSPDFYLVLDLDDAPLSAGTRYGFLLAFSDPADSPLAMLRTSTAEPYTQGTCFSGDGTGVFTARGEDLVFHLSRVAPEPGALGLAAAGLALVAAGRRRRRPGAVSGADQRQRNRWRY